MVTIWPLRTETYKSRTPVTCPSRWLTHTDTHAHTPSMLSPSLVGDAIMLHCVYKAKVPLPLFTRAGMIPCVDKQENKKPADDRERGCHGAHSAVGRAERVEATDGEGIHCVLCNLDCLFCFLCPGLAFIHSLQQAFHSPNRRVDIMLSLASIQTPAHTLLFVYLS